jgi:hypothetical protein
MSLLSRSLALKAGLAAAVAVLATTGTVAGVATASATPTPRAAFHPAATTSVIDHQLCYTAAATGFKIPTSVMLANQLNTAAFPIKIGPVAFHCNPVEKIVPTGKVFPINFPNDHLLCWSISAPTQPVHTVQVANQFGTARLVTGQPNYLCLPSWKSLTGPPVEPTAAPPGLGHFACYPVQGSGYKPPPVMLQDEFSPGAAVSAQVSPQPQELCVPTEKIVNGKVYKIIKPQWKLLCFPVTPTPIVNPVFDKNQFGNRPVTIEKTATLCPPSTMKVIS